MTAMTSQQKRGYSVATSVMKGNISTGYHGLKATDHLGRESSAKAKSGADVGEWNSSAESIGSMTLDSSFDFI